MAKGDLIRVPGYSQKVIYNGNIEYRNFSDNLVGNQSIININDNTESSSLFTMGNFVVTTSSSNRSEYSFKGKDFTQFYDLTTLNFTNNVEKLISNNVDIKLNLDNNKLSSYAYFGSATEFIRVTLEDIITYWPASLYVNPLLTTTYGDFTGLTVENYIYDAYNDKASFDINVTFINNNFELVFTQNGNVIDTFNEDNKLRNFTLNYIDYVIAYNDTEYDVLEFTGSTNEVSGYVNMVVEGDPFKDITTTATSRTSIYHIRPNKLKVDEFFNNLNSFEQNILNRYTVPKYTSTYDYDRVGSDNVIYKSQKSITWPLSDGYNIDFSTNDYVRYVNELIAIATSSDKVSSDILTRFLVADSIADFDSLPKLDGTLELTSGQKMTKILKIYGRNFDEVKIWMDGLKLFNTVTYDKKNNTPDQLVKGLAKNLGWELTTALSDNDLLKHYVETNQSTYSGQSTGLSVQQAETEMWRRLILNSAWLFKSKGSRKSIEFFFKFLGIPKGLVDLNEYIYKAKNKIDMNLFYAILNRFNLNTDLSLYNLDSDGFPKFPAQTSNMYFQKSGLWYRQTAGTGTSEHILTGNNPHIGPYDGGKTYLAQLYNLIPDFQPFTIVNEVKLTGTTNLFHNYNKGKMNYYSGKTFIDVYDSKGAKPTNCLTTTTSIIADPYPNYKETVCGCPCEVEDDILSVCLKKTPPIDKKLLCNTNVSSEYVDSGTNYNTFPNIFLYKTLGNGSIYRSQECCKLDGGIPYKYDEYLRTVLYNGAEQITFRNTGYVCTKSLGEKSDLGSKGASCFLTCQWQLPFQTANSNGTSIGTAIGINNPTFNPFNLSPDMFTWSIGSDLYLKFASPVNLWGRTGKVEFKYTHPSDSCFCNLNYTTPELVTDPDTNIKGYACKLNAYSIQKLNSSLIIFYKNVGIDYTLKARGDLPCATHRLNNF